MRKNQQLVIVLPEGSEELPIRIVRGSRSMELRLCLCPPDGERHTGISAVICIAPGFSLNSQRFLPDTSGGLSLI